MNTRFPAFSTHRPLFTGSPSGKSSTNEAGPASTTPSTLDTIKEDILERQHATQEPEPEADEPKSPPGFVTPPTPSTIKTDEYTVKLVQGAWKTLQKLVDAGTIDSETYLAISKGLEKSEETSDDYKEKGQILYSKLMGEQDNHIDTRDSLNRVIGSLKRQNTQLQLQVAALQPSTPEKKPVPTITNPLQRKVAFQRPKSGLRNSLTANPEPTTTDTAEPDKTPHAGNIKSSDRQL